MQMPNDELRNIPKTKTEGVGKMEIGLSELKILAEERSDIYRIFSNEKRILIFWLLMEGESSVNDIAERVGTSMQNTSQHLRLMKDKGIVKTRREGNEIHYRIAENEIGDYCKLVIPIETN